MKVSILLLFIMMLASNSYASYTCTGLDDNDAGVLVEPNLSPTFIGKLDGNNVVMTKGDGTVALAVGGKGTAVSSEGAAFLGQQIMTKDSKFRLVTCTRNESDRIIHIVPGP